MQTAFRVVSNKPGFNEHDQENFTAEIDLVIPDDNMDKEQSPEKIVSSQSDEMKPQSPTPITHQQSQKIPAINQEDELPELNTTNLSYVVQNNAVSTKGITSVKVRKSRKFSDIRLMFEEKTKHLVDDRTKSLNLDSESNRTGQKRLRSRSLPTDAEKFFNSLMENNSAKNSICQFIRLLEGEKSGQSTPTCSNTLSEDISGYHSSVAFHDTLKCFEERAIARIKSTTIESAMKKCLYPRDENTSESFTPTDRKDVPSGLGRNEAVSNTKIDVFNVENGDKLSFADQLPPFDSMNEVQNLIKAILSGELFDSRSDNHHSSVDEVIANYHNSKEFYDTLIFFEEKAKAGSQSAIQLVSAMRKYSGQNIKRSRRSLPTETVDVCSALAKSDVTCTDTLHIPENTANIRRRSTPMDFAPTDQRENMISEGCETTRMCAEVTKFKKMDTIQSLPKPLPPNSIDMENSSNDGKCRALMANRNNDSVHDRKNASISTEKTTPSQINAHVEQCRKSHDFIGNFESSNKVHVLLDTQTAINSEDLFLAAIVVAKKQHIDVKLDSSIIVNALAHTAAYMRFRMTSHRIPFDCK